MNVDEELAKLTGRPSAQVEKILKGLWRQREELGIVAEELLELFRAAGLTPPPDDDG
jgi:Fe2+ or Zn2+ uptake regulation protein